MHYTRVYRVKSIADWFWAIDFSLYNCSIIYSSFQWYIWYNIHRTDPIYTNTWLIPVFKPWVSSKFTSHGAVPSLKSMRLISIFHSQDWSRSYSYKTDPSLLAMGLGLEHIRILQTRVWSQSYRHVADHSRTAMGLIPVLPPWVIEPCGWS